MKQHIQYMRAGALTLLMLVNAPVFAVNASPAEIAVLPAYCDAKIGSKPAAADSYWDARLGHGNWIHMHHYCGGLVEMNRYYRQNPADRLPTLERAIWEFDYVLKYTSPDFSLRADAHYNRGKVLLLEGKNGLALGDFQKALELNPGMPAASIELANLYKKQGKKEMALSTLKAALEKSPAHKGLQRNYLEMGGSQTDFAEIQKAAAAPAPLPPAAPKSGDASAKTDAHATVPEGSTTDQAAVIEPKIGNMTNPWCRFCPDDTPDKAAKPEKN